MWKNQTQAGGRLMAFSRILSNARALEIKVRRAKTMSKGNVNPDFDKAHPDWVRDAQNKNYTSMSKIIRDNAKKFQDLALARRMRFIDRK